MKSLFALLSLATLAGCIQVTPSDKPIEINLNVNVKQEVVVRLQKDAQDFIANNPELFPEMTRQAKIIAALAATLLLTAGATRALAADPAVESALESGAIGEQWDGYLGFVRPPASDVKAAVDAINIKRRAGYTQIAASHNVTVDQFGQTTACNTLKSVRPGQAYRLKDGWHVRQGGESITPDYCG